MADWHSSDRPKVRSNARCFRLSGSISNPARKTEVFRMKRAAGRTKVTLAVEELGALRDELDQWS